MRLFLIENRNSKKKPGFLYCIELLDADNTKFYKIGITTSMKNRFYNFIENNHGKVLWIRKDTLYNCFLLEQKILQENTNFLYRPMNLDIGGKTECLTKEIIDDF